MSIILDNIKCLADNEGIGITKLEEKIGASKGVLSRAIAKNSDIQAKWISKIVEIYPQYSCEWLIRNESPMLRRTVSLRSQVSDQGYSLHYKDLADSRKETIESLKKEIFYLEDKIEVYKKREE